MKALLGMWYKIKESDGPTGLAISRCEHWKGPTEVRLECHGALGMARAWFFEERLVPSEEPAILHFTGDLASDPSSTALKKAERGYHETA